MNFTDSGYNSKYCESSAYSHDDVVIIGIGFFQDNIINLLLAEHYSRMLCKKLQDFKLRICKLYLLIIPNNYPLNFINHKTFEIFLLIVLCFHIEITLHHNIFICDFHICSSVQRFSCIMVCLIIC